MFWLDLIREWVSVWSVSHALPHAPPWRSERYNARLVNATVGNSGLAAMLGNYYAFRFVCNYQIVCLLRSTPEHFQCPSHFIRLLVLFFPPCIIQPHSAF